MAIRKNKTILFFSTSAGYGHINRDIAIAEHLTKKYKIHLVTGVNIRKKIEDVTYHKIPYTSGKNFINEKEQIEFKMFRDDIGSKKLYKKYIGAYLKILIKIQPDLVVCDLDPEISFITKYLGYKTVHMFETGIKNKLRMRLVYKNADAILVPYTKDFSKFDDFLKIKCFGTKTFYSGGFSRIDYKTIKKNEALKKINIPKNNLIIGVTTGGTGYNSEKLLKNIITAFEKLNIKKSYLIFAVRSFVAEKIKNKNPKIKILTDEKYQNNATNLLYAASDYILTGSGYNSVMEASLYRKPMIIFPFEISHNEQVTKSQVLTSLKMAVKLDPKATPDAIYKSIKNLIEDKKLSKTIKENQKKLVDKKGSKRASDFIEELLYE
jgi:uncharacterized protein (TIGR00661 family)